MHRNIHLLYLIYSLKWFVLMLPVTVLYFQDTGLTGQEIFTLTSIYAISIVLFEVPSGYLADVWGRKNSIIAGFGLSILGNIFFLIPGFYYFLIAEIFLGIGASFISGCDTALFFDSLKELDRTSEFKRLIGKYRSYGNFSEGISGLLGGAIASFALLYTIYGRILVLAMGFVLCFFLREPKRESLDISKGRFNTLIIVVKYALLESKIIRWLILYSSILGVVTLNLAWFSQFFFKYIALSPIYYGVVWAILQFSSGIYARLGNHYVEWVGLKKALYSLVIFILLGYWGLSFSPNIYIGVFFILICYFIRGVNLPVLGYYLHKQLDSDMRATIVSLKSLLVRLLYSAFAPIFGFIIDVESLQVSLRFAGIVYSVLAFIGVFFLLKIMK